MGLMSIAPAGDKLEIPETGPGVWLKRYRKEIIFALIIFLTSTISFGAGYLVNRETHPTQIIIEKNSEIAN